MGNSLHSDNPICPVNVIVPDPKFFNPIPKSPNPTPLPIEKRSEFYSAVLWSVQIGRVRENSDFGTCKI